MFEFIAASIFSDLGLALQIIGFVLLLKELATPNESTSKDWKIRNNRISNALF